jgi:hypothetical protein
MIDETNSTRRQMIAGGALGLAAAARAGAAKPGTILTTKAIHQEEDFKCGAQRIYEALLDAGQFRALADK